MFLFEISKEYKEFLATIRQWSTIKIAFTETSIWLKDFTDEPVSYTHLDVYKRQMQMKCTMKLMSLPENR